MSLWDYHLSWTTVTLDIISLVFQLATEILASSIFVHEFCVRCKVAGVLCWHFKCSPQVPDYYDVIKDPMDFGTMYKKISKGVYQTLALFEVNTFVPFKICKGSFCLLSTFLPSHWATVLKIDTGMVGLFIMLWIHHFEILNGVFLWFSAEGYYAHLQQCYAIQWPWHNLL